MWQASRGNALFVRHFVEGALEAGTLRRANGVWQLRGAATATPKLAALLSGRLDQLLRRREARPAAAGRRRNPSVLTSCPNLSTPELSNEPNGAA